MKIQNAPPLLRSSSCPSHPKDDKIQEQILKSITFKLFISFFHKIVGKNHPKYVWDNLNPLESIFESLNGHILSQMDTNLDEID